MDNEPLLSPPSPSPSVNHINNYFSRRRLGQLGLSPPLSSLCPLPENGEISIPVPSTPSVYPSTPSALKARLIFGSSADENLSSSPPLSPNSDPGSWWTESAKKSRFHRCATAPAMAAINDFPSHPSCQNNQDEKQSDTIVRQAIFLLVAYLLFGVVVYSSFPSHFSATETHPVVDALYFCIVTMCTIGYGDITPLTPFAKLFSITFVLFGFGFLDILLSSMVTYVLDLQESILLSSIKAQGRTAPNTGNYLVDVKKGRMRIRMKVGLALAVVILCIGVGAGVLRFVEELGWLDSFYLSVMSVTTVGYGDRAFKTMPGRLFASLWLLVSTLAVARAFLFLAEARIDKRHRKIAKWVISRDMTVSEFLAADIDHNGFVSKSEFVIYKLKEMGKIAEKDIMQICDQFDRLDPGNCGKITLSDLLESHNH